jgi:hypothetical protein
VSSLACHPPSLFPASLWAVGLAGIGYLYGIRAGRARTTLTVRAQCMVVETLVVRRSVGKTVLWVLAAVALIPIGGALALGGFGDVEPPTRVLGWLAVAAGAFGVVRLAWQLRRPGPVMEIGPAGFHDRRLSAVPIPWQRIDSVSVREKPRQILLSLSEPTAREYVRSGLDSSLARGLRGLNGGVPITVVGLDHSLDDVFQAVRRWHGPPS